MALTFSGAVPIVPPQTSGLSIVVTGAARGIGFELVKQYALAHPANQVVAAVRKPSEQLTALATQLANVHIITLDVDSADSIRASVKAVERVIDHIDVLINNAAIIGPQQAGDVLKATGEQLESIFHTNVTGVLLTTQAFVPLLTRSTQPKVINVGSALGSNQLANAVGATTLSYGLSKAALCYLTTVFRHVVPNVTFICIHPGWVATDMGNSVGAAPTKVNESVQALRYYIDQKKLANTGEFVDAMTGELTPY